MEIRLKATRITDKTEILIHNIFINNLENLDDSINGIVFSDISYHLLIIHLFNTDILVKNRNTNEHTVTYKREYNENNINAFKCTVKSLSWKEVLNETDDPKNAFDEFLRLFIDEYETHFPLKRKQNK